MILISPSLASRLAGQSADLFPGLLNFELELLFLAFPRTPVFGEQAYLALCGGLGIGALVKKSRGEFQVLQPIALGGKPHIARRQFNLLRLDYAKLGASLG